MNKFTQCIVPSIVNRFGSCSVRFSGRRGTRSRNVLFVAILVVACVGFNSDDVSARVRHVPSQYKTIQRALDLADVGDTVLVGPGTYSENLVLKTTVSLISSKGAEKTIIDGGRRGGVLMCQYVDSTATIQGFTFRNGVGFQGGGILLSNSFPTVTRNVFTADSAQYGGGLCALWSNSVIKNNEFIGNKAEYGGAFYTMFIAPTFDSNRVENNRAKIAGGLYFARSSEARVRGNTIIGNVARTGGGAFLNRAAPAIERNVFKANGAEEGGAIYTFHSEGLVKENVFCDNTGSRGAAIALADTVAPDVLGNTIVRNSAPDSLCAGIYFLSTYLNVTNNIIAHNSPGYALYCLAGAAPVLSCNVLWDNQTGNYSGVASKTADIYEDPLFCAAEKDDFSVREGSPALGKDCGTIGARGKGCGPAKGPR